MNHSIYSAVDSHFTNIRDEPPTSQTSRPSMEKTLYIYVVIDFVWLSCFVLFCVIILRMVSRPESHAFKSYERFTVTTSHIYTITEPMIPPCPASIESIFSMLFNVKSIRTHFVATQMCDFVWYLRRFFSTAKTRSRFKRNMKTYVIGHGEHDGMCGISIWNISDFSSVWQLRPSNPH